MRVVKSAEERKNEILDVAEELFESRGFDHTSTNDIINAIGIARGTLYHHFKSKEDILDAMIERISASLIEKARTIAADTDMSVLERMTAAVRALNVKSDIGKEVMTQMHKPQNALLHQKVQDQLIGGIVPLIARLIREGCDSGIFNTAFPLEAADMIMIYSNIAFDGMNEMTPEEQQRKLMGFIYHTERILGTEEGALKDAILGVFAN